ncbi:MAG: hypothetical protein ACOZCO_15625 [Bacteroidota bacterium]
MNKYLLFVLFISAPLFLVAQKADDMKEKGDKYFRKGNYEKAFVYYKKADSLGYITKGPGVEYEIELCSLYLNGEKEKIEQRRNYADSCFKAKNFSETYNTCYQLIDDEYPDDDKKYSWLFYKAENNMHFWEDYREADSLMKNYQFEKAGLKYHHLLIWKDIEKNKSMIADLKTKLAFCEADTTEKHVNEHARMADSCRLAGEKQCALENMIKIQDVRPEDERYKIAVERLKREIEYDKEHTLNMNKYYAITAYKEKDFSEAMKWYRKVVEAIPGDTASLNKISECEEYLGDPMQSKIMRYNFLVAEGDKLLSEKHYNEAKKRYEEALSILPSQEFLIQKIAEIHQIIKTYNIILSEADTLYEKDSFSIAKNEYENALRIMPHEKYPKDRIYSCTKNLRSIELEEKYNEIMQKAKTAYVNEDYETAIDYYNKALSVTNDPAAKDGIAKCKQAINERPPKQDKYTIFIKKADELFFEKKCEQAKTLYAEASLIKPGEQYPKDQIMKCDMEIKNKTELMEKEYQEYMKLGDWEMKKGEHDKAIDAYIEALKRKPDDPAAKDGMETATYLKNRKN